MKIKDLEFGKRYRLVANYGQGQEVIVLGRAIKQKHSWKPDGPTRLLPMDYVGGSQVAVAKKYGHTWQPGVVQAFQIDGLADELDPIRQAANAASQARQAKQEQDQRQRRELIAQLIERGDKSGVKLVEGRSAYTGALNLQIDPLQLSTLLELAERHGVKLTDPTVAP